MFAIAEPVRVDTSIRYRWLSLIRWYDERVEQHLDNAVAFAIVQILFDRLFPPDPQALIYIQNQTPCLGRTKTKQVVVLCPDLAETILSTPSRSIGEGASLRARCRPPRPSGPGPPRGRLGCRLHCRKERNGTRHAGGDASGTNRGSTGGDYSAAVSSGPGGALPERTGGGGGTSMSTSKDGNENRSGRFFPAFVVWSHISSRTQSLRYSRLR